MTAETEPRSPAPNRASYEVLVIDADTSVHRGLLALLQPENIHLSAQSEPGPALEMCETKFFGVILVDLDTPGPAGGVEIVREVRRRSPQSTVIVLTPRKSFEGAIEAFRAGASDVIQKSSEQVEHLLKRVLDALQEGRARDSVTGLLVEVRESHEEFLKILMASERRAQDAEDKVAGRDPAAVAGNDGDIPILCVDGDDRLYKALVGGQIPGFAFTYAQSGGEALDRTSNHRYHIALIGPSISDLPPEMVVRAIKQQAPELIAISYTPNGLLAIVENTRTIIIVDKFTAAKQLVDRLNELAEGYRAKGRERRYLQAFRERNYEFLRRFNEQRQKLARAINVTSGGESMGSSSTIMAAFSSGGWPMVTNASVSGTRSTTNSGGSGGEKP